MTCGKWGAIEGGRMTKKYRPSNGSEGEGFMEHWCIRCWLDRNEDCPILANALCYGIDDPEYPAEWVQDENGARCTAFIDEADRVAIDREVYAEDEKRQMRLSL